MPVVLAVIIAPPATEEDQRHQRAIDKQRGCAIVVAVARINIAIGIIRRGRISGLGIPISRRVPGLRINRTLRCHITTAQRKQQGCQNKTMTHFQGNPILFRYRNI
jgi:hypothetical protein